MIHEVLGSFFDPEGSRIFDSESSLERGAVHERS